MGRDSSEIVVTNFEGDLVSLGPLRNDLFETYYRWFNHFETTRMMGDAPKPYTLDDIARWYDERLASKADTFFLIYERATARPIGVSGLNDIDYRHDKAEFVIMIGESDSRGKGYGTEATRLTLDYGFTVLGMHNIVLTVHSYNPGAVRAYEKVGFREIGRRRQARLMGGKRWDSIYMDCLASEFSSPVLGKIFPGDQARA